MFIKKRIQIKQHDSSDCGATCLASIAKFYGLNIPLSWIRQMASTDKLGTNVLGLIEAASKIGLLAKGVKSVNNDGSVKLEPLYKIPKPAIAHIINKNNLPHFVVIYNITQTHIKIMDPAIGKLIKVQLKKFASQWTGLLVILAPDDDFDTELSINKASIFKRFLFLLKPHRKVLLQALFGAIVYTLLGLSTSIFVQKIVDYIIPDGNKNLLNLLSIVMVLILILSLFVNYTKSIFMLKVGLQIDARLILGYYKHLLRLPQSFFDNMRSGEIISRINDAINIRVFINDTLISVMVNVFTVIFAFALMFTYYWKLATIILLIVPWYLIIYLYYNHVNKIIQRRLMENAAELQAQLVESINTVGTIKSFGLEEFSDLKTESIFIKFLKTGFRSSKNSVVVEVSTELGARIFTIILLWCGTYYVLESIITPGELLSFYALISYFINPINSLVSVNRTFQDAKIAADRLFDIMDLEPENMKENKISLSRDQCGDIEFQNVSFRYGTRTEVFDELNLKLNMGSINAIVGESGSGKSTLASLLQNLYSLKSGKILIGGIDIRHIDNSVLRSLVCVIPQRIDLFEGSVLENITLDDIEPDISKVLYLCKEVGILAFIEALPEGFATNIGENGVQLSGGQRQMLAIVRALYRNPEILILDEATSALDSVSELHIKNIINQLKAQGKTIIMIAHRLGTIVNADQIFVLKEGKLIEKGTHKKLIEANGSYASYWNKQTQV